MGSHFKSPNTIIELVRQIKRRAKLFFPELHRENIVWRCLASCQLVQSPGPCQGTDLHVAQRRPETSKPLWSTTWCCTMGQVKKNNVTQRRSELLYPECTTVPKIKVGHINAMMKQQNLMMCFHKSRTKVIFLHCSSQNTLTFLYFCSEDFCIISVNTGDRWMWQSKQGPWIKYDRLNKEL